MEENTGRQADFQASAAEKAQEALDVILEIMTDDDAGEANRLRAAGMLLERAYGKPDGGASRPDQPRADRLADIRAEVARLRGRAGGASPGS